MVYPNLFLNGIIAYPVFIPLSLLLLKYTYLDKIVQINPQQTTPSLVFMLLGSNGDTVCYINSNDINNDNRERENEQTIRKLGTNAERTNNKTKTFSKQTYRIYTIFVYI